MSAPHYQIIRRPIITEKGLGVKETQHTVVFEVSANATKTQIKEAVQQIFKVKVAAVRTANLVGKLRQRVQPGANLFRSAHRRIADVQRIAGLAPSTAARLRARKGRLQADVSDRLFRIAAIYALAKNTLESDDRAARWLSQPNRALGGKRPVDMLDTHIGTQQVEVVLNRLEHGIYS